MYCCYIATIAITKLTYCAADQWDLGSVATFAIQESRVGVG